VLLIASGIAIVRGRWLPVWTGWLALVLAVVTFAPLPNAGAPAAGLWTLVVSIVLLVRMNRGGAAVEVAGHARESTAAR
jgi:hypothetical protein